MELNNIIFSVLILCFGYFLHKYSLFFLKGFKFNHLIDDQFKKPQAFHEVSTHRLGGVTIYTLFILTSLYLFFYNNIILYEYLSFCTLFFFLGLIDDFKINIKPKFRLLIMIFFLVTLVIYNEFYITKTGFEFLNNFLEIDIFAVFFVCLCFLFIINGANLIDGFNGLLSIHALIILTILFIINITHQNYEITNILFFVILIIAIFLKFNFPKAQLFLGDSGAYLIGSLIGITIIKTSILEASISPLFFCILLFYLFFEVFFSFFRKILFFKRSPLLPDNDHLHMLLYKFLIKKKYSKLKSNYTVSIYINLIFLLLILPAIFFMENGLFCRYYFFSLLIIYVYFYKMLYKKVK